MCYLVQLGVPVRYAAPIESPRAFRVVPQDNPSVRAAMGEAFATFGNPSGLNANYQADALVELFAELRAKADRRCLGG